MQFIFDLKNQYILCTISVQLFKTGLYGLNILDLLFCYCLLIFSFFVMAFVEFNVCLIFWNCEIQYFMSTGYLFCMNI